jgi:hypothetical protein
MTSQMTLPDDNPDNNLVGNDPDDHLADNRDDNPDETTDAIRRGQPR